MGFETVFLPPVADTQSEPATDRRLSRALVPSYQIHPRTCNLTQNWRVWTNSHLSLQEMSLIESIDLATPY
jgi:hypothetical protein